MSVSEFTGPGEPLRAAERSVRMPKRRNLRARGIYRFLKFAPRVPATAVCDDLSLEPGKCSNRVAEGRETRGSGRIGARSGACIREPCEERTARRLTVPPR